MSRLITFSKPFYRPTYLPPCALDSVFADIYIVHVYKLHLLSYLLSKQCDVCFDLFLVLVLVLQLFLVLVSL